MTANHWLVPIVATLTARGQNPQDTCVTGRTYRG